MGGGGGGKWGIFVYPVSYFRQGRRRHAGKAVLGTCVSCAWLRLRAFAAATGERAATNRAEPPLRRAAHGGGLGGRDPRLFRAALDLPQPGASVAREKKKSSRFRFLIFRGFYGGVESCPELSFLSTGLKSDHLPAPRLQLRPAGRRVCRCLRLVGRGRRRNRRRAVVDRPDLRTVLPCPEEALGIPATRQASHAGATPAVMIERSAPACQQLLTVALLLVAGGQDPDDQKM